jgi:hypothetical protein
MRVNWLLILVLIPVSLSAVPKLDINQFIGDTLIIPLPVDSIPVSTALRLQITDDRPLPGRILGIQQTKKWKYIPLDQYLVLNQSLDMTLTKYLLRDAVDFHGNLYLKNLTLWYDGKPAFHKGRKLNCYTILEDSTGQVVGDWMWEETLKPKKKQKDEEVIATLMDRWLTKQVSAISKRDFHSQIYPYLYRRQLLNWWDLILIPDGLIINAHLTLDFPPDQQKTWIRGSPGIYYRRSKNHESIAIGGMDQLWYARINAHFIRRLDTALRFGFNNFESSKYKHLDFWNIFMLNFGTSLTFEYRSVYLKGFYGGVGLYAGINLLPTVIKLVDPGILITAGVVIP